MNSSHALALSLLVPLIGCGPSTKELRGYIAASPRHQIAILPLAILPNQKNVVPQTMQRLQNQLFALNFKVLDPRAVEQAMVGQPAITYAWPSPKAAAQIGQALNVSAVMIGRIDRASEPGAPGAPLIEQQRTTVVDAQGNVQRFEDRTVLVQPRPKHRTVIFAIRLRLVDTKTGRVYWENNDGETFVDSTFTLLDTVDGVLERLTYDLAENYYNRKL